MLETRLVETMREVLTAFPLYHPTDSVFAVCDAPVRGRYNIRGAFHGMAQLVIYVSPDVLHVAHIEIPEVFRGKGLGKRLLTVAEQVGQNWGCNQVHLISKDADGFYRKCGYTQIDFPEHTSITDLMVDLPFFMKDISQSLKTQ